MAVPVYLTRYVRYINGSMLPSHQNPEQSPAHRRPVPWSRRRQTPSRYSEALPGNVNQ